MYVHGIFQNEWAVLNQSGYIIQTYFSTFLITATIIVMLHVWQYSPCPMALKFMASANVARYMAAPIQYITLFYGNA